MSNKSKKEVNLPKDTPIINMDDEDFEEKFSFALWSTNSSSDHRNDRERPYNGQSHTDEGARGQKQVKGLTMRDVKDCFIMAVLDSAATDEYLEPEEFDKCWDFSTDPPTPTQYLLDNQDKYAFTKVETGNWRHQDIYKIDLSKVDPGAIAQNLTCRIEKMMGIFPNMPKSTFEDGPTKNQ